MAKNQIDMIKDVLDWSVSDKSKVSIISDIVGAPVSAAPAARPAPKVKKAAVKAPRKAARRRKKARRVTRKTELWTQLKKTAPEKLAGLAYRNVKITELEKLIEQ